jgi:hypothetical protein
MRSKQLNRMATFLVLFLFASVSHAQSDGGDVYWHIDPSVKSCSMVIDPSLTQTQWHTFTKQAGAMATFKSLAPATTLGKMNFRVAIDYSSSPVDQHDPAWINTFTHPDADCPLGDAIRIPTIRAAMGVSDNMDFGCYWTTAPGANYGVVGGELKYAFLQESQRRPAAAMRASVSILTGVPDFNLNIYSVDLMTSKKFAGFAPYVGFRQSLAIGAETTSKVDLDQERLLIAQGYAGVAYSVWKLNLAAEYDVSFVNTFALVLGFSL